MAVTTCYCLKKLKLTRMYEKMCNLLRLLTSNSKFHVFNGAAYPYNLSRLISFDLISPWIRYFVLLYNTCINGDMSPYTIGIFRQTERSYQVMEARVLAVKHIQTLKVALYKYL